MGSDVAVHAANGSSREKRASGGALDDSSDGVQGAERARQGGLVEWFDGQIAFRSTEGRDRRNAMSHAQTLAPVNAPSGRSIAIVSWTEGTYRRVLTQELPGRSGALRESLLPQQDTAVGTAAMEASDLMVGASR